MLFPTNFLIGVGMLGAVLVTTRFARLGRKCLIASVALLAICAYSPIGFLLLYPLESRFPPWDPARGAPAGVIVLGGSIDADLSAAHGVPVTSTAGDRMIVTAELARLYPDARIVYSGGTANLVFDGPREADYADKMFESLGIPKTRLLMERSSRNTYENAELSKALLAPKSRERWLLVTSAFHMPRSVGLFRKAGFNIEPYPVDWRVGSRADLMTFTDIAGDGLARTDLAVREWIGLLAYRVTGKIDELFPGPVEH
jgi:uncharacterized SAM-binding protein YcdF (DUF218 family)